MVGKLKFRGLDFFRINENITEKLWYFSDFKWPIEEYTGCASAGSEVRMEGGSGKKITKTKYYRHKIVICIEKTINE